MKKIRQCLSLTLTAATLLLACIRPGYAQSAIENAAITLEDAQQAYLEHVDTGYSYDLALRLEDIRSNETLGYRTAGSQAELDTGDMLKA